MNEEYRGAPEQFHGDDYDPRREKSRAMRPLEEIARGAANEVCDKAFSPINRFAFYPSVCEQIILSALTEATREQEAKVRQLQESLLDITEASCKKNAESEAQVAKLRKILKEIASYHPTRNVADLRCIADDALKS